jgi:hypothetical protein
MSSRWSAGRFVVNRKINKIRVFSTIYHNISYLKNGFLGPKHNKFPGAIPRKQRIILSHNNKQEEAIAVVHIHQSQQHQS